MFGCILIFISTFLIYIWLAGRVSWDELFSALLASSIATFFWFLLEKDGKFEDSLFFKKFFFKKFLKFLLVFPLYLAVFLFEMVKANLDVALRVISPSLSIRPGIMRYTIPELKSRALQLLFANSITLTPGTMTVEIEDKDFLVHRIDVKETSLLPVLLSLLKWVDEG